jgi:3-oxoacyl-[acyl-carrier-protein] synthase-3
MNPATTGATIVGLGAHRPARVVTNEELARTLDTDDKWIGRRTGIGARRIAGDGETVVEMATQAARKAVAAAGRDPGEVDLVVLATCSAASSIPSGAASVATRLGAHGAGAFDLNAACAGFCYGLSVAADAVRSGSARCVVVAGSERMSDTVDWSDRASAILFGDGAGAAVVSGTPADGVGPVVWGSDGSSAALIEQPPGGTLRMDGQAVYRWAVGSLAEVARAACTRAGIAPEELDGFVPHQANGRIIDALATELGLTGVPVAHDVAGSGNTSSASIPLALSAMRERGELHAADRVLLLGFGAGLTWAGQVVTVP